MAEARCAKCNEAFARREAEEPCGCGRVLCDDCWPDRRTHCPVCTPPRAPRPQRRACAGCGELAEVGALAEGGGRFLWRATPGADGLCRACVAPTVDALARGELFPCPYCRAPLAPRDVVRDVYFREETENGRWLAPDPAALLCVHEWRAHDPRSFADARAVNAARGQQIPARFCRVSQEGLPLALARALGMDTWASERHAEAQRARDVQAAALGEVGPAVREVARAVETLAVQVGGVAQATAAPESWGKL